MCCCLSPHTDPVNITLDGHNLIQTRFEPTEIMSTYLLAFVVCDFTFTTNTTNPHADVLVTIYNILPHKWKWSLNTE